MNVRLMSLAIAAVLFGAVPMNPRIEWTPEAEARHSTQVEQFKTWLPVTFRNFGPYVLENFNRDCGGGDFSTVQYGCTGGEFQIRLKAANRFFPLQWSGASTADDFDARVDARFASNGPGALALANFDTSRRGYYAFWLTNTGDYYLTVTTFRDGSLSSSTLIPSAPAQGFAGASNRLGLRRQGSSMTLFLNNTLLTTITDTTLLGRQFGMVGASFETPEFDTRFDNLMAYPVATLLP